MAIPKALRSFSLCLPCFLSCLLASCGGGAPPQPNPVPSVQSVSPATVAAGSAGFTLTINGSNFLPTSTLTWSSTQRNVTFVSSSQLTTVVSSTDLGSSGTVQLTVSNPGPGGGQSSASFNITAPAAPVIASVSPGTVNVGGPAFTLTVVGSNFVSLSAVQWNGVSQPTTYVDNAHLTATIPASAITAANAGNLPITVATPAPGGGSSNSIPVTVEYPLPSIASLSPNGVVFGSAAFTLTVNGNNFANGALVYVNSLSRVTQFISSTQLTASILASDVIGPAGNLPVTVQNPSPSAGVSNVSQFMLLNPAPVVTSVTPSSMLAGNATSITITGTGFVPGGAVEVSGQSFPANFASSTSIGSTVTLPVGSVNLTASNPSPTVGVSNGIPVTGTAAGAGMSLIIASVDPSGNTVPTDSAGGALSSTGRYFTFSTFLRDTCLGAASGCTPSTIQFTPTVPQPPQLQPEYGTGVSTDGRYISSIPCPGSFPYCIPPDGPIIFFDTCRGAAAGCIPGPTDCPSAAPGCIDAGIGFNNGYILDGLYTNYMTPNARYISYSSKPSIDTTTAPVNIYDTCVGAAPGCSTTIIDPGVQSGNPGMGPRLSDDGRYFAYIKGSPIGLSPGPGPVVLHDSCLGAAPGCSPSDTVISSSACRTASVDGDGQYVIYVCSPAGLILQATCVNASPSCTANQVSVSPGPDNSTGYAGSLVSTLVSTGGRFVAYEWAGAINGTQLVNSMVFVFDSCIGAPAGCVQHAVPVCLNASGAVANANCNLVGMTSDGQFILFRSTATNFGPTTVGLTSCPDGAACPWVGIAYIVKNPSF